MKITLELPDTTTCVGLFVNVSTSIIDITTTNWITKAKDGKIIRLTHDLKFTEGVENVCDELTSEPSSN